MNVNYLLFDYVSLIIELRDLISDRFPLNSLQSKHIKKPRGTGKVLNSNKLQ